MAWTQILAMCALWPWVKVKTHPWVMDYNCVKSPKNTNMEEDIEFLLSVKFRHISFSFCSIVGNPRSIAQEKSKMSQPMRDRGGHLVFFQIGPKNIYLVKYFEFFIPVKFGQIPFGGFREEVENVSANKRPGPPSCSSDRLKNPQTWQRTSSSCFLSSFIKCRSSVSEKSKMPQSIRGRGGHHVFPIGPTAHLCHHIYNWNIFTCDVKHQYTKSTWKTQTW